MDRGQVVLRDGVRRRVKTARTAHELRRTAREAELLEVARHPGVVELVALESDEDGTAALVTGHVDGPTLAAAAAIPIEEVAGVAAGVAATVADLHGLGVVHGAVWPEHVLLAGGRPVLCGLAYGARTGQAPIAPAAPPPGFLDAAREPGDPLLPSTDVYALGALIGWLLLRSGDASDSRSAGPRRAGSARRGFSRDTGRATMRLRALAARATAADASRRPTAREVAAAIQQAVPGSHLPQGPSGPAERGRLAPTAAPAPTRGLVERRGSVAERRRRRQISPPCRRRRMVTLGVGAGLVAVVTAGLRLTTGSGDQSRPPAPAPQAAPAPPPGPPTTGPLPPTTDVARPAPDDSGCRPAAVLLAADTDGDGCPETLRFADGILAQGPSGPSERGIQDPSGPTEWEVETSARWAVGQTGDQVATGDWTCSGVSTLALLRPTTGEVFVFAGWAPPGRDLVADLAGRVEGGFALRAAHLDGDTCPELVVDRAGGPPIPVPVVPEP